MAPLSVLYEDNHLLVVLKPADLPTMGTEAGRRSLLIEAKQYIKQKYQKPGNVYLGIVSRLDALVTGVMVLARTSKAASRLSEQFRSGEVEKIYWALVPRPPRPASGECLDWLRKDERLQRVQVSSPQAPGAREARLSYRTLSGDRRPAFLEIQLHTGRKHQIRVQLAARDLPILGDRKYGSTERFPAGIALHARRLVLTHPVRHTRMEFEAPLPPAWKPFLPAKD